MNIENLQNRTLLLKAIDVYFRYGYKKTTLDEVASAVDLSRQTIYQKYKSKKNLFIEAVTFLLDNTLNDIESAFNNDSLTNEEKLVKALDLWGGYYIRSVLSSPHVDEIITVTNEYVGDIYASKQQLFKEKIADFIFRNGLAEKYEHIGVTPKDLATNLFYTQKGIIHLCNSYENFIKEIRLAVKIIFM